MQGQLQSQIEDIDRLVQLRQTETTAQVRRNTTLHLLSHANTSAPHPPPPHTHMHMADLACPSFQPSVLQVTRLQELLQKHQDSVAKALQDEQLHNTSEVRALVQELAQQKQENADFISQEHEKHRCVCGWGEGGWGEGEGH